MILTTEKYLPLKYLKKLAVIKRKSHKGNAKCLSWTLKNK